MVRNINITNSLELGTLMEQTFVNLPFFPFYPYILSNQSLHFVPMPVRNPLTWHAETMARNQDREAEIRTLELLRQNNQEMKALLASIEEQFHEAYILEKLLVKKFEELIPSMTLVQCLSQLTACTLNTRNKKEEVLVVMV